ncbi:hypothetical protein ACFVS2_25995 [Brevibacillus sp. NPDC058079]|uniref:hypothetical protein n=1 Tax=Brevibacillus sp. NPDC058079 TaxID=3346330 RepID=UPI0036E8ED68
MSTIQKLRDNGFSYIIEVVDTSILHPNIECEGELFLGELNGKQTLMMVKERDMDNSDGEEWQ